MNDDKFRRVEVDQVPKDSDDRVEVNLYVHLPSAQRFICFVIKGDKLDARKIDALRAHADPRLFVLASESVGTGETLEGLRIDTYIDDFKKTFAGDKLAIPDIRIEVIGKETEIELREIYKNLLDPAAPEYPGLSEKLARISDDVVQILAPEVKDLKSHLMRNVRYLHLMNDSSAITSLTVLFALANGFDSQKSYRELSYAALIMDLALAEFGEATMEGHYRGTTLPEDVQRKFRQHPLRSYELAAGKLKTLTDLTMQLIQNHHELYNGKGYPRGIRNESLSPISRVLSMAVDTFEILKRQQLEGATVSPLPEILRGFIAPEIEPHQRRHSTSLVQKTLKFLEGSSDQTT